MARYYMARLWKITYTRVPLGRSACHGTRIVKHYERREAVGEPWIWIRSSVQNP